MSTSTRNRPLSKYVSTLVTVGVVIALIGGWNYFVVNGDWRTSELRATDAVVIAVDEGRRNRPDRVTLEYRNQQNSVVTGVARVRANSLDEQGSVRAEYIVAQPEKVRVQGNWRPFYSIASIWSPVLFVIAAVVGLVGPGRAWLKSRREKRPEESARSRT